MPISLDEFKKGETRNSREEIVYQLLGDGKAHSSTELENEVGIIQPKTNSSIDRSLYMLEGISFEHITLDRMIEDGRIVSKSVHGKDGTLNTYYMRKEFVK